MVSKIDKKKQEKIENKKTVKSKDKKGIQKFLISVLKTTIYLLIYALLSANIISCIKFWNTDYFLPSDTKKYPYAPTKRFYNKEKKTYEYKASFPYDYISQSSSDKNSFLNSFLNSVADTFATDRKILKETFQKLNEGFTIIEDSDSFYISEYSSYFEKIISGAYMLLSPILLFILPFISYFNGLLSFIYFGFTNNDNIIYKIIIFIGLFFGLTIPFGIYGLFGTLFYLLCKGYDFFDKMINIKQTLSIIRENKELLTLLFTIFVLVDAFKYLNRNLAIGLLIGFIILNLGTIIKIAILM
jgi:hypothetical protein